MLKKLDWYILKKFLGTFFFSISLILIIVVVFDVSEKIDDFIQKEAPLKAIIVDYYFNFLPFFANLFSPLFTFIAVIFFTSRLASNTEIVAILNSGVSFWRLMRPYLLGSLVIAVLSLLLTNFVIPDANKKRLEFERKYIRVFYWNSDENIHKQIEPGVFIYVANYNTFENIGDKFSLEKFENGKMTFKLMSRSIAWDSAQSHWEVSDYFVRSIRDNKETIRFGEKMDTVINLQPRDFGKALNSIDAMNQKDLHDFIDAEKEKGSDKLEFFEIEKHKRIAFPFATVILTIIGVSMSSRKVRGGIGLHIGIGLLISFSFILFMQVTTTFAASGLISAFVSVWIPNIVYGILGLYLLTKAPK